MEELNEMLADLAEVGALDSSGVFTVSLARAEEKLAAYRLTNPGLFVLNLLAAAVSAGASQFAVESHETRTRFSFDPKLEFGSHDLEDIFTYILKPTAPAHLRELALALHGARALPETPRIRLTVGFHGGQELVVAGPELQVRPAPEAPTGVRLELSFPSPGVWAALFSERTDPSAEILQHLYHFCRFAPLKLSNNGQVRSTPVRLGGPEVFAWRAIRGSQPMIMVEPRGHYPRSDSSPAPAVPSTILIGFSTTKTALSTGLLLVSRGVTFKRPQSLLGFPMACAIATADHLEKNLSQSDLVEDDDYHRLLEVIQMEIQALVLDVCTHPPDWSSGQSAGFARALQTLYPLQSPAPAVVEAFRRSSTIEDSCRDPAAQAEQMEYWRGLKAQDPAGAQAFGESLASAVERQAQRRLANGEWSSSLQYLLDLGELGAQRSAAFIAAVMLLADREDSARELLASDCQGSPPLLEALIGWDRQSLGSTDIERFLEFERAVASGRLADADAMAQLLQERKGTSVLYLWLGWYQVFRGRHSRALGLWEQSLTRVRVEERERWADILWPALLGKVSFLEQVGWQARRAFESLQFGLSSSSKSRASQTRVQHPARWAKQVWEARIRGSSEEAQRLFLKGYLSALLNLSTMSLEPLDSPEVSLAPFHNRSSRPGWI